MRLRTTCLYLIGLGVNHMGILYLNFGLGVYLEKRIQERIENPLEHIVGNDRICLASFKKSTNFMTNMEKKIVHLLDKF